ncbi:MAG TPA: sigma-70 family RNA polymerase sigma factor [Thermoanaerobaculia bacterium]
MTRDEFSAVVLQWLEQVTAFARRLTSSAADADDLLQITYEQAFRSWRTLRDARAGRAWLFRIARNAAVDRFRRESARPEIELVGSEGFEVEGPLPSDPVESMDLEAALSRLPADQMEAIVLSDLWGFTYEEIAAISGCAIGTVRSRISRGRARLLKVLRSGGAKARERRS